MMPAVLRWTVYLAEVYGVKPQERNGFRKVVESNAEAIKKAWHRYFGNGAARGERLFRCGQHVGGTRGWTQTRCSAGRFPQALAGDRQAARAVRDRRGRNRPALGRARLGYFGP